MDFDFSDEVKLLRDQARKFLQSYGATAAARRVLEGAAPYDQALWRRLAEMGWLGTAIPEEFGGVGLGHEALCVLAEELGATVAPVPFSSSIYFAAEAILACGSDEQKRRHLPPIADGSVIGTFALAEGSGNPGSSRVAATVRGSRLSGTKLPVADGAIADLAIVAAKSEHGQVGLYLVELAGDGVTRETLKTVDPSRNSARLNFANAPAERLGSATTWDSVVRVLERAAILMAFEQVGGAQTCLDMAKAYASERYAFGRPIGSFQAIKHKLADVYIATELARSNAYYAAWAIATGAAELPVAAAAARVAATDAYHLASKENIQTHGGIGFTWEMDCHLYYRRSKLLALAIGSSSYWKDRLITELELRNRP